MASASQRVDSLDTSLFTTVLSQTSEEERRTLLAVQRAIARRFGQYTYLEIGSYLGGSLQPHVADPRCTEIFSIDPRPDCPPDDRVPGDGIEYTGNTKQQMLTGLSAIDPQGVAKIVCIDSDAQDVPPTCIAPSPHIAFIDGEHTHAAALSDFAFCEKVVRNDGVILFHDFGVVHAAIHQICRSLDRKGKRHLPLRLEGSLFGVFFNPSIIDDDPYLAEVNRRYGYLWTRYIWKRRLRRFLPEWVFESLRKLRTSSRPHAGSV
jgi:hypothetical protein